VSHFSGGLAMVLDTLKNRAYVNKAGKIVWRSEPPQDK
jgi:hypothetical protein